MRSLKKIPWTRVVAEGAVIVLSILLAFAVDAWWTDRGEQMLARAYIQDLSGDLVSDSSAHALWSGLVDNKISAVELLLADLNGTGDRLSAAEALTALNTAALVPTLQLSDATYRDLVGSGNLRILSPDDRRSVVRYYTATAGVDRALSLYERQGKPPFTGLIPGRIRGRGPAECSEDPLNCTEDAELGAVDAWRTRPTIREELQLERGNAQLARQHLDALAQAMAEARVALGR